MPNSRCTGQAGDILIHTLSKGENNENVQVGNGNIFGFAINIHDNDSDQRNGSIHWSAGMADEVWNTPQLLGTLEFLPDHKLKLVKRNAIDPAARPGTTYLSSARLERIPGSILTFGPIVVEMAILLR